MISHPEIICLWQFLHLYLLVNLLPPPPPCHEGLKPSWPPATSSSESLMTQKEVKSWPANLQGVKTGYNPLYSGGPGPVSPPTSQDVPPLLDFPSDGLMSDIHNITFDLKEHGLGSLYSEASSLEAVPVSRIVSTRFVSIWSSLMNHRGMNSRKARACMP